MPDASAFSDAPVERNGSSVQGDHDDGSAVDFPFDEPAFSSAFSALCVVVVLLERVLHCTFLPFLSDDLL